MEINQSRHLFALPRMNLEHSEAHTKRNNQKEGSSNGEKSSNQMTARQSSLTMRVGPLRVKSIPRPRYPSTGGRQDKRPRVLLILLTTTTLRAHIERSRVEKPGEQSIWSMAANIIMHQASRLRGCRQEEKVWTV